ncbi:MAG: MATE family efflux transporter [Alphaproteobacteria bacterium]
MQQKLAALVARVFSSPEAGMTAIVGIVNRLVTAMVQFLTIRLFTDMLEVEHYAPLAVVTTGLLAWYMLADAGLGASLQNFISEARAKANSYDDFVVTGLWLALAIAGIFLLLILIATPLCSRLLLGDFSMALAEKNSILLSAAAVFGLTTIAGIIYKYWFALQRGYISNLLTAIANILGLILLGIYWWKNVPFTPSMLIIIMYGPACLLPLVTSLMVWLKHRAVGGKFCWPLARNMLERGGKFWFFALMSACVLQVDYIILARTLPPHDILVYTVATRLFMMILAFYNPILFALWPVFAENYVRRDVEGIKKSAMKALQLGGLMVVAGTLAIALGRHIILPILTPTSPVEISWPLIGLFFVYLLCRIWTDTLAIIIQAMNDFKVLWLAVPIQAVFSVGLQYMGVQYWGLHGLVLGQILCFALSVMWIFPLRLRQKLQQ